MHIVVGTLCRHVDGCLSGVLKTLTIRTQVELRPVRAAPGSMTYEVMLGSGFIAGHAVADGRDIHVIILSPELTGPLTLRAVLPSDGGDEWQLTWAAPG